MKADLNVYGGSNFQSPIGPLIMYRLLRFTHLSPMFVTLKRFASISLVLAHLQKTFPALKLHPEGPQHRIIYLRKRYPVFGPFTTSFDSSL